jgi:hypothetical protein
VKQRGSFIDSRSAAHSAGAFDGGAARMRDHEAGGSGLPGQHEDGPGSMGRMMKAGLIRHDEKSGAEAPLTPDQ